MRTLNKSSQSGVICPDDPKRYAPIELAYVCNALLYNYLHIFESILAIKHLSENRTSGTINLCAIVSARRLNEKLQHGGINHAYCH